VSKNEESLSVVTTAELQSMIGSREQLALAQHKITTELALSQSWLKLHFEEEDLRYSRAAAKVETLEERLAFLQNEAVKSALLGYWLHESEFEDAKRFRDERVIPMLSERLEPEWNVKMRLDYTNGSKLRFFIAKSALGLMHPEHGIDTAVVERRTFAAYASDGSLPRPSDMNHALGISERHPNDGRVVAIAPTSTSFYAFKPDLKDDKVHL